MGEGKGSLSGFQPSPSHSFLFPQDEPAPGGIGLVEGGTLLLAQNHHRSETERHLNALVSMSIPSPPAFLLLPSPAVSTLSPVLPPAHPAQDPASCGPAHSPEQEQPHLGLFWGGSEGLSHVLAAVGGRGRGDGEQDSSPTPCTAYAWATKRPPCSPSHPPPFPGAFPKDALPLLNLPEPEFSLWFRRALMGK